MYVELRFGQGRDPSKPEKGKSLRAEELLAREKPLALRGVAGAGKTTWVRYTFGQLVRDERALPMMLVLRDVARHWQLPECAGEERSIDAALDDWIGSEMGSGWRSRLRPILKTDAGPRPILLVDGWDELGPLGGELRGKLLGFLREHPRVLAVVTSRPYGDQPPSHGDGFDLLDVQPLSEDDIALLTRRFFVRFGSGGKGDSEQRENGFFSALERSVEAQDLARTPLLLTMMLLVGHSQPLPEKRHLLYEKCIDALLLARPEQRIAEGALVGRHVWCPPGIEERRRWVAALAYGVQTRGYKERSRAPIIRSWDEMRSLLPQDCPAERCDGFLAWLVEIAGLLTDRTDATLAFAHLSFQEYLTACHLETTADGRRARQRAFEDRLDDYDWWETLRLLAAQIEGRNPEFPATILHDLLKSPSEGSVLAFIGTVLADGFGSVDIFSDWQKSWAEILSREWPGGADLCSAAWHAARRTERKIVFAESLAVYSLDQTWLGWLRIGSFGHGWAKLDALPSQPVARGLISALPGVQHHAKNIAVSRLIGGIVPLWPSPENILALLQLWPSQRRLIGLHLQSAVAAGAPSKALYNLTCAALQSRKKSHPLLCDQVRHLARNLSGYWGVGEMAFDWARDLVQNSAGQVSGNLVCDYADYASSDLAFYLAEDWDPSWARFWTLYLACGRPQGWACGDAFARALGIDGSASWFGDFARTEICSIGRFTGRSLLATEDESSLKTDVARLLSQACYLSLHPEDESQLSPPPAEIDPLWPALARHLARQSTAEDRALLIDLAQHPEKREPPLQWGLRFIVRGDLMLDDGSFLTLDELADEIGVERLPYLDEMEPELEVDWDAKEPENERDTDRVKAEAGAE